jgi:hypothetical protein
MKSMKEAAMTKPKRRKLNKNILVAFAKLRRSGDRLCRQSSTSEEGISKGGGFIYFLASSGKEMPPVSSRFLIDQGLVEEEPDGLFVGSSQTFRPVPPEAFDAFREKWEAPAP